MSALEPGLCDIDGCNRCATQHAVMTAKMRSMRDIAVMLENFFRKFLLLFFSRLATRKIDRKLIDCTCAQFAGTRAPTWRRFNDLTAVQGLLFGTIQQ